MSRSRDNRPFLERGSLPFWIGALSALGALWLVAGAEVDLPLAVLAHLALMSLITLALFAIDKRRSARSGTRRVAERVLLGFAALGGAAGGVLGMTLLRHKTKHLRFRLLIPLLALLHAGAVVWLMTG